MRPERAIRKAAYGNPAESAHVPSPRSGCSARSRTRRVRGGQTPGFTAPNKEGAACPRHWSQV